MSLPPPLAPLAAHEPDTNERILRSIMSLYAGSGAQPNMLSPRTPRTPAGSASRPIDELGMNRLSVEMGTPCAWPRRKLQVMLVGNHSAGKSTFINWYVGEEIQRTGTSIETSGFILVTSGKRRETLHGPATLRSMEQLSRLADLGATGHLQTEVCTSRARAFPLITFVDTPGLVDGFDFAFPIEACIDELAKHCDLILVFFDPNTQALCERTLGVVRRLNVSCPQKLRCFLSKADLVPVDADRDKVRLHLAQTLTSRASFSPRDLPCLFIPGCSAFARAAGSGLESPRLQCEDAQSWRGGSLTTLSPGTPPASLRARRSQSQSSSWDGAEFGSRECRAPPNHLDELCADFERAIEQTVQSALDAARRDCSRLTELARARREAHETVSARDDALASCSSLLFAASLLLPVALSVYAVLAASGAMNQLTPGGPLLLGRLATGLFESNHVLVLGIAPLVLLHLAAACTWQRRTSRTASVSSRGAAARLAMCESYLRHVVGPRVEELYDEYLAQSLDTS